MYIALLNSLSFSGFTKVLQSSEVVDILALIISQSKTLKGNVSIVVTGNDIQSIQEIQSKLQKIPFVMIQARPTSLTIEKTISPHTNILLNLSSTATIKQPGLLTVALSKKQIIQGADIAIVFDGTRPIIYINKTLTTNPYHRFEQAFLQISKEVMGAK